MPFFNIVAQTNENTVVTEYEPVKKRSDGYQSEAQLEKEFIRMLCEQGYEYLPIHTEAELVQNLRAKLETLNAYIFSDDEWKCFFSDSIANPNEHIKEKARKIQEDFVQVLKRDDGTSKNITLIPSEAFLCCLSLSSIVIPDSVKKIESCAFMDCENLSDVRLSPGTEVVLPRTETKLETNLETFGPDKVTNYVMSSFERTPFGKNYLS